jgi:hypothetical protein
VARSEAAQSARTPPYVSYRTFKTFLDDLSREGVPSRIDRSVLTRFSGVVGTQLVHALRFFGLVEEDGRPTERLRRLAEAHGSAHWPDTFAELLRKTYAPMFAIDLEAATPSHFSATFRKAFPAADAVVQKCVTFFLYAASDAGVKVSGRVLKGRKPRAVTPPQAAPRRTRRFEPAAAAVEAPAPAAAVAPPAEGKKPSEWLLQHFDPGGMDEAEQAAVWTLLKYFRTRGL